MPGYEVLGDEEKAQVMEVLARGVLFRYEFANERGGIYKVKEFEEEFRRLTGSRHALAVSSGTAALKVGLAAMGIGPGDEVLTQGFTFVATWEAILDVGAIPVFVEIDETFCMDPGDIPNKISSRTKAIVPVHMCGGQARIQEIIKISQEKGLKVLEDNAQACGGTLNGRHLGTFGDMGAFSFDSVKTITTGEGGMLITDNEELYIRASEYHDHGHIHAPGLPRGLDGRNFIGFNYRMMEIQGALGLAQLKKLYDPIIKCQRENKARIKEELSKVPGIRFRHLLDEQGDIGSFLMFMLPSKEETHRFNALLKENGVPTTYWYENLWHYYKRWEHLLGKKAISSSGYPFRNPDGTERCGYREDALPKTEEILSRTLTIAINVRMEATLPKILEGIKKAASNWKD